MTTATKTEFVKEFQKQNMLKILLAWYHINLMNPEGLIQKFSLTVPKKILGNWAMHESRMQSWVNQAINTSDCKKPKHHTLAHAWAGACACDVRIDKHIASTRKPTSKFAKTLCHFNCHKENHSIRNDTKISSNHKIWSLTCYKSRLQLTTTKRGWFHLKCCLKSPGNNLFQSGI